LDPVFRWYGNTNDTTPPFFVGHEYKTSALGADTTFYVSVSGSNYCEGSVRDTVEITIACFTVRGTVFPLVFFDDEAIDTLFTIEVRLYIPPPPGTTDPPAYLRRFPWSYRTTAVHYDGSVHVPGTPKYPGFSGSLVNPGAPINWRIIGRQPPEGTVVDTTVLQLGEVPVIQEDLKAAVGYYTFTDVAPGNYILTLSRVGHVTRYAKVTVASGRTPFFEHRELIGGDVNGDLRVDAIDINSINSRLGIVYGDAGYDAMYDINGNSEIDAADLSLTKFFQGFHLEGYEDTLEFLMDYRR
jgi:hypothetical protein